MHQSRQEKIDFIVIDRQEKVDKIEFVAKRLHAR